MELYARVRRAVQVEGRSERRAAREFGISRETVRKMLRYSIPPGYSRQQPIRRPKLDAWAGIIDQILEQDEERPSKQRPSAKRIFERLQAEHEFPGGYTIVKDYVRERKLRRRETSVPLLHPPGQAQVDFGEALVVMAGQEQKARYFCLDLPHSDDCFVMAFPAETTEAFLEGHVQAFAYLGGAPQTILYMLEARDEKRLLRFQKHLASFELLIVDELGFVPLSKTGAEMLFDTMNARPRW